jgi:hypothetical protein
MQFIDFFFSLPECVQLLILTEKIRVYRVERVEIMRLKRVKQPVMYTIVFHGDYVKMCEDFSQKFDDKKLAVASRQCTISYFTFHQGILV